MDDAADRDRRLREQGAGAELVALLYESGYTASEIAARTGCSVDLVHDQGVAGATPLALVRRIHDLIPWRIPPSSALYRSHELTCLRHHLRDRAGAGSVPPEARKALEEWRRSRARRPLALSLNGTVWEFPPRAEEDDDLCVRWPLDVEEPYDDADRDLFRVPLPTGTVHPYRRIVSLHRTAHR